MKFTIEPSALHRGDYGILRAKIGDKETLDISESLSCTVLAMEKHEVGTLSLHFTGSSVGGTVVTHLTAGKAYALACLLLDLVYHLAPDTAEVLERSPTNGTPQKD